MELEFGANYLVGVIFFLVLLCCNKNFILCLQDVLPGCGRCVGQFCEGWICCDKEYCTQDLVRVAFTLFCFLQPLILCILYIANSHRGGVDTASTVIFCQLKLNHTTVEYKNLNTSTKAVIPMNLDLIKSECTEVDYILIALPFAIAVSFSNFLLTYHINDGVIGQGTTWDNGLDPAIFSYELAYYFEIWCMNFGFLAGRVEESSFDTVYYQTHALTIVMILFISMARYSPESIADQWISILTFGLLFILIIPMLGDMMHVSCVISQVLNAIHAFVVVVLSFGHYMALGNQGAGYILTVRSIVTIIACLTQLGVLVAGRNAVCRGV